ncbi:MULTISPECIES: curli production assembly/transport component CsgF [unclassified Polaribacter]|jgi:curli production assembly/transport component CsgF|uniref:curli production assembly/transport component CsgF n=1 Tax=unclassified Polaribacter TaxID=196858 RepID=UPI001C4ED0D4|nr:MULTISPECIES: curli production assembly/transport component CsgF [unclassified Polaribacter]QXP63010.1 curli assembly protein CsgF [Polaribacter sp. HaHaR_3_91]QXP65519.1 curli assembly protein CsgF [Polaribacter sp. AHE13PA]QXP71019.1 curli assembly protein CsgF [Polaribacter sp. R2A056_3_33]
MKRNLLIILFLTGYVCVGQQLSYKPINPAFGGETFNYQWLLNSANAQNSFKDPSIALGGEEGSLAEFSESLNRQILSQLSRSLFNTQLGEDLKEGNFSFGSLALEIYDSAEGLVVNILDTDTGEQTQIIVPN